MHTHHSFAMLSEGATAPDQFSRLFPGVQPLAFSDTEAVAYANAMESVEIDDNPDIPAAYTYLGQFLDHDLTFDPVPNIRDRRTSHSLINYRTPRFDLDCVYGVGPTVNPYLYDNREIGRMLIGKGRDHRIGSRPPTAEDDLPRNAQGVALVGDPRNDQNVMVSQIQLAILRFHNRIFELQAGGESNKPFRGGTKTCAMALPVGHPPRFSSPLGRNANGCRYSAARPRTGAKKV